MEILGKMKLLVLILTLGSLFFVYNSGDKYTMCKRECNGNIAKFIESKNIQVCNCR